MATYSTRECPRHGQQKFRLENGRRWRCVRCAAGYVARHRKKIKRDLVALHGGACERCGYSKSVAALQFHHRDPTTKMFGIAARGITRSWEAVVAEATKCELLCANCHAEQHAGTEMC